jgi:ATP-dependent DNA helicase RecG
MRPEILFPLFAPITSLSGVGPKLQPLIERAAGPLVRDLLLLAPSGLVERTRLRTDQARDGQVVTLACASSSTSRLSAVVRRDQGQR